MKKKKNKCYAAGIVNRRDDWAWQGTVVAPNIREAKKLVTQFKKENGFDGRGEVVDYFAPYTNRKIKVYNSTIIH
jgi:hypothetical protein